MDKSLRVAAHSAGSLFSHYLLLRGFNHPDEQRHADSDFHLLLRVQLHLLRNQRKCQHDIPGQWRGRERRNLTARPAERREGEKLPARGRGFKAMDGKKGTSEDGHHHTGCGRRNANPALPAYAMDQEHGIRSVQPMDCPFARGRGKATDDGTPRIF